MPPVRPMDAGAAGWEEAAKPTARRIAVTRLALAFAALLGASALAAGASAQAPAPPKPGGLMNLEQLRSCAEQTIATEAETLRLGSVDGALNVRKTRLEAEGKRIDAEQAALDRTNRAAIDSYNARIDDYKATTDAFNRDVDARNAAMTASNEAVDRYNAACSGRRFREADVAKLSAELQRAVRSRSGSMTSDKK